MWWFVGGYLLIAAAFYTYIVVTAQEEPEEAQYALGRSGTLAGWRDAAGSEKVGAQEEQKKSRAA
ncbi:MAG TPA: hypothetical protein VFW40_04380 [Capsulimonadaceae bacterium]|nr:hypothetical protein [Capsulimonadaceae bacterium]